MVDRGKLLGVPNYREAKCKDFIVTYFFFWLGFFIVTFLFFLNCNVGQEIFQRRVFQNVSNHGLVAAL